MITKLFVLQQIDGEAVNVAQISGDNFQWTFKSRRSRTKHDQSFFPFNVNGNYKIWERTAGDETILVRKDGELVFCDDYGVPGGTVIGILFPKGYIPDVIKFKDKPYIPVGVEGLVSTSPPGHLQILYNFQEKRSAIVFNINNDIVFGFKCIARKVDDEEFPHSESLYANHLFDVSISRDFLSVDAIRNEDLKIINDTLANTDVEQIKTYMNALLAALKAKDDIESKSLLGKLSSYLNGVAGSTSALVTIADSYKLGNSVYSFISQILKYVAL